MIRTSLIQDFRSFSLGWQLWMLLLQVVNLIGPLFFLGRIEAWVVIAGYIIAAILLLPLHRRLGWVRLLGVIHFQWFIILPWIAYRFLATGPSGIFGAWLLSVLLIDGICLAIDIVDVIRYLAGDRQRVVGVTRSSSKLKHS